MAKDNGNAAQGRVNIFYSSREDERSEVELPFKVLVMGDFTLAEDETPLNERESIPVNAENLNAVMRALAPRIEMSVRDILRGDADSRIPVRLGFESLEDFTPKRIAEAIGPLREAAALRRRLLEARKALSDRPELVKDLKALLAKDGARERLSALLEKGPGAVKEG
ncbi:MAG: type VI secretion system contractile sheath small subunit [Deltaproteobacteria bacterium]|jgi:type VI secretion system protein ImpB|nr:type VI secretion system contractile sheath small subunit [Deltaproteobacteria bacterium]